MGRQAVQQQEAIPLLHDGPLRKRIEHLDNDDAAAAGTVPVLLLLHQTLTENVQTASSSETVCARILKKLSMAGRIKDQLATLQAFKSTIIQKNRRSPAATGEEAGNLSHKDGVSQSDWNELECVYHVLLEWSLGCRTPLPLRRTIHSILESVYEIHPSRASLESVFVHVLESISAEDSNWSEPLDSLDALLSLAQIRPTPYREVLIDPALSFLCRKARSISEHLQSAKEDATSIAQGVKLSLLAKTILQDDKILVDKDLSAVARLCWDLLHHRLTPADALPVAGMAYSRAISFPNQREECLNCLLRHVEQTKKELEPLPRVCVMQGLAARVADDVWVLPQAETDALRLFQHLFDVAVRQAIEPEVRLAALKGTRTLVSRSITLLGSDALALGDSCESVMREVSDNALEIALQAWENPPTRKLASSIPLLFQAVIDWKEILAERSKTAGEPNTTVSMDSLVDRILAQPPYRKGKYKALESLLPKVGASSILKSKTNDPSQGLLADLLAGVADASHNTGAMADLWAKLLQSLFMDIHEVCVVAPKKSKTKTSSPLASISVSKTWFDTWVPSLANALVSTEWKRRKQVAAFCLPRILPMVTENLDAAAQSFATILDLVGSKLSNEIIIGEVQTEEREDDRDRTLWAMMEIIRYSVVELNLGGKKIGGNNPLGKAIAENVPLYRLRQGLSHFSPTIRVTCFQAMEGVVQSTFETPMECCICEAELWRESFPYAEKADLREYLSLLFYRLLAFLDRLSRCEASEQTVRASSNSSTTLPVLGAFVNEFLLGKIMERVTYPGSVIAKETFGLSVLESIIVLSCRDLDIAFESKLLPKTGAMYERKRSVIEEKTLKGVRTELVGPAVLGSLFSLIRSSAWEGTKAKAFDILSCLLIMARNENIPLPSQLFGDAASSRMEASAIAMASSPRPREADTGARILAILGLSRPLFEQRMAFVKRLAMSLDERLRQLKDTLEFVLKPDTDVLLGKEAPLVHGIIRTLRLVVEAKAFEVPRNASLSLLDSLSKTLCSAMQVSLAVVGDVRDGENLEGTDDDFAMAATSTSDPTKGKINPGAIGANGIFSSVSRIDPIENERRLASQRIIVGTWLLTKEACAAIAAVLTTEGYSSSLELSNTAGTLLISTLTSLKHTGAAYAAHSALQVIARATLDCNDKSGLCLEWIDRLCREITDTDKIRDSTLRRSTGYALGFLSVMRAEISLRSVPRSICLKVTHQILSLTLPPPDQFHEFLSTVGFPLGDHGQIFSYLDPGKIVDAPVARSTRSRVHSLNVLRMMILDAPLSQEIFPVVGDALVSAIMGYVDSEWSVRNSAGMVFSACMLRVVDADKNASNTDTTSKNAISVSELFQSYPALCSVLLAVLSSSISGNLRVDGGGLLPPILPILVLLYRVQPLHNCNQDVVKRMQSFCPVIMECLGHRHLSVRQAAARALCNLRGGGMDCPLSLESLRVSCFKNIRSPTDWNRVHGAVLLLKELCLAASSEEESIFTSSDAGVLLDFLKICDRGLLAPPLCLMDAIRALESTKQFEDVQYALSQRCLGLIVWISQNTTDRLEIAGISELCSAASSAAAHFVTTQLFSCSELKRVIELVGELSFLLECDIPDARVVAVKTFKRLIYRGVDALKFMSKEEVDRSTEILHALSREISTAIAKELSRVSSKGENSTVGTHPPTLRRLSRCLLELNAAYRRIAKTETALSTRPSLRELGLSILDVEYLESEHPTPLVGNAVELLASDFRVQDAAKLMPVLENLSCAVMPWRLRCSVACAVAWLWKDQDGLRNTLRPFVIRLLQDEDPDARYIVVKAITDGRTPVPENVLVRFIQNQDVTPKTAFSFLEALGDRADALLSEMRLDTENGTSGYHRKIFEAEDPNSYHEPALSDQATLWSLWDVLTTESSHLLLASQQSRLLVLATRVVCFLSQQSDAESLTRVHFTTIHTLLLATTAAPQDTALTDAARCLLSSTEADTPLHPCLEHVLRLVTERGARQLTRSQIQPFFFLLNPDN